MVVPDPLLLHPGSAWGVTPAALGCFASRERTVNWVCAGVVFLTGVTGRQRGRRVWPTGEAPAGVRGHHAVPASAAGT